MAKGFAYQSVARICGSVFAVLAVVLLWAPEIVFDLFDLEGGADAKAIARRAAVVFAGMAYLLFSTANHIPNPTLQKITEAMALLLAGLALVGVVEWARGNVGSGVWLAIITEILLAALLAVAWRSTSAEGRRQ